MIINFVGNFTSPNMVGEVSDETHLARELERLGHTVNRIPRDAWREFVIEGRNWDKYKEVPADLRADINLIAKWHHFYDGSFVTELKELSQAPVFYWVWDFMGPDFPDWHIQMAKSADLYLSGEMGLFSKYKELGVKPYYFQMDVCDGDILVSNDLPGQMEKKYDVVFTGSYYKDGHRLEWLKEINKQVKVVVFGFGYENWIKDGFEAHPPVYGSDYNRLIAQSKIVLGFGYTIPCWGYWSNRVGKVLRAGGHLLQEYIPGMETQLPPCIEYFNTPQEAIQKIRERMLQPYIDKEDHLEFTSAWKSLQLSTLMENYLKGNPQTWNTI